MTMTDPTQTRTPRQIKRAEMPDSARRMVRWAAVAIVIALAGLALGGVSLGLQASVVGRDSARNTWDQATGAHVSCVSAAKSRTVTIETSHDQFDAQSRQLDAQDRFVDLIEGIVGLVPVTALVDQAFAQTAAERARINDDRAQLATDVAAFDESRPPLREADCPPPPNGPRP